MWPQLPARALAREGLSPHTAPSTCHGCGGSLWTAGRHFHKAQLQEAGSLCPAPTHMHTHVQVHRCVHDDRVAAVVSGPQLTLVWYSASASALLFRAISSYWARTWAMMLSRSRSRLLSMDRMTDVSLMWDWI